MKCPDCGSRLADVSFGLNERAMRCFRCGGFWIDSVTVNRLPEQKLTDWRRISIDPIWLKGGKGNCPLDNQMLIRYIGDAVPRDVPAMRCIRCGKWWFPGDSLFNFVPALESKVRYMGLTGNFAEISKIGLPILVAVLLLGGMAVGVNLVKMRTQTAVPAAMLAQKVAVTYMGEGRAVATFTGSFDGGLVKYRVNQMRPMSRANESELWSEAAVSCIQAACQAKLIGLEYGKEYVLVVGGEEYLFEAK